MRAVWCAKEFRDFPEIYNVSALAVTQDKNDQALISRLAVLDVSYANALALGKRFISSIPAAEVNSGPTIAAAPALAPRAAPVTAPRSAAKAATKPEATVAQK